MLLLKEASNPNHTIEQHIPFKLKGSVWCFSIVFFFFFFNQQILCMSVTHESVVPSVAVVFIKQTAGTMTYFGTIFSGGLIHIWCSEC